MKFRLWNSFSRTSHRRYASTATVSHTHHSRFPKDHDNSLIRHIFDNNQVWADFSAKSRNGSIEGSFGLVRNRHLKSPEDFLRYAHHTSQRCQRIVDKSLAATTVDDFKNLVRDYDRLSDTLCRIMDLSNLIQVVHPSPQYQKMAKMAFASVYEYMNQLNTTTTLNDLLKKAVAMPEIYNAWTAEERTAAQLLIKDFSKSAITLPDEARGEFVDLSNQVLNTGAEFVENISYKVPSVLFRKDRLKGVDPALLKPYTKSYSLYTSIPVGSSAAQSILWYAQDPDTRFQMLHASRQAADETILSLESMLMLRSRLAKLAGYQSFAHMNLSDKMAQSPEAVNEFLLSLKADAQTEIQFDLDRLLQQKTLDSNHSVPENKINAWDKDYYTQTYFARNNPISRSVEHFTEYTSLGTVFQGLSNLFSQLYGISLVPAETLPGEVWHEDVRRLDVVDENHRIIAILYCDLFARSGKPSTPAHFTLRCSRLITSSELAEYSESDSLLHPFPDPVSAATEGVSFTHDLATNSIQQHPTIALICDFDKSRTALLGGQNLTTMFHEMGHALHSILGQTSLQIVAGTRCATDLAEVPSVLMEKFAVSPEVLQFWARHHETNRPPPTDLFTTPLDAMDGTFRGLHTEEQILISRLDQALHGKLWCDEPSKLDSTAIYHSISATTNIPDIAGSTKHGFYSHLNGYGAGYYSYLFAQSVAGEVWRKVFDSGKRALDRRAGEKLKEEFLKHGGARDGWNCVAGLADDPRLTDGGKEAMKIVGKWGVGK